MRVCADWLVLPLIRVKGSPITKMTDPNAVAAKPPGRASSRSVAVAPGVGCGGGGRFCAPVGLTVNVRVKARMGTMFRGIMVECLDVCQSNGLDAMV